MESLDEQRRRDELEALRAVYGDNHVLQAKDDASLWTIRVSPRLSLEVQLPPDYPSQQPPKIVRIRLDGFRTTRTISVEDELLELWDPDTEVVIVWAERCRVSLEDGEDGDIGRGEGEELQTQEQESSFVDDDKEANDTDLIHSYYPPTSKFGQTIRHFDSSVVDSNNNTRTIFKGKPYHPPKSGPAECMLAHVASVESMDHVQWVLAQLLLYDKKVAKASHNMIAYRFMDNQRCLVSDNDDDGERGAGTKLAALLELADAQNVIVVVSRWYGGIHLGPARFKYIASVARGALQEFGFLQVAGASSKK